MALTGQGDDCQTAWKHLLTNQCIPKWDSGQENLSCGTCKGSMPKVANMGQILIIFPIKLCPI